MCVHSASESGIALILEAGDGTEGEAEGAPIRDATEPGEEGGTENVCVTEQMSAVYNA